MNRNNSVNKFVLFRRSENSERNEFSYSREQGTQKGTFSVKSYLCFREQGTKRTFLVKNSLHSREQKLEMRNTSFKRTKKGTHVQFRCLH